MTDPTDTRRLNGYGFLVVGMVGVGSQQLAQIISRELFLIHEYGFDAVWAHHLTFVDMSKGKPWLVSDGTSIDASFSVFVLSGPIWFALFATFIFTLNRSTALRNYLTVKD